MTKTKSTVYTFLKPKNKNFYKVTVRDVVLLFIFWLVWQAVAYMHPHTHFEKTLIYDFTFKVIINITVASVDRTVRPSKGCKASR